MAGETYSKEDIARFREAHAAINRLEAAKHGASPREIFVINDAIGRWRTTLGFLEERGEPNPDL